MPGRGSGDGGRTGGALEWPGARAYDIKHYNYYLNSSRMAPGVAAVFLPLRSPLVPSSCALFLAVPSLFSIALFRFFLFVSLSLLPSRLHRVFPLARTPPPSPRPFLHVRLVVRTCSHALFALVYRSPLVSRPILLLFRSRFAPAPPARRRDSTPSVPSILPSIPLSLDPGLRAPRPRRERTVATIDPIL